MTQEAFKELLEAVEAAIQAGDWKVDGACDPDLVIRRSKEALAQTQEPVHNVQSNGRHSPLLTHMMNKQTTPPQRKPLTDEEINAFFQGMEPNNGFWLSFARAIEAAHGIKGEA